MRRKYVVKRLVALAVTVYLAITFNFILFRTLPGNAVTNLAHIPGATPELRSALTREFGLNDSLPVQYVKYLYQLLHLNLGVSFDNQVAVSQNLRSEVLNTFQMLLLGTIVAMVLGILAGLVASWRRGTSVDHGIVLPSLILYALPTQWLGLMLIVLLGSTLPTSGRINYFLISPTFWQHWLDVLKHMILPSLTIGVTLFGQFVLIVRSAVMETLGEDYILVARGVGYAPRRILIRFAFRNAILPTLSAIALNLGFLVGGAILVETVFSWPGVGLAVYNAILQRDYPMMQGAFLVLTVSVIFCNFIADILYLKLDPRVS